MEHSLSSTYCNGVSPLNLLERNGAYTEPTLPPRERAKKGEVEIVHNYRSNDHAPAHVHINGGGQTTRTKLNRSPMPGDPNPTSKQQKAIDENWPKIERDLRKVVKWIKYSDL